MKCFTFDPMLAGWQIFIIMLAIAFDPWWLLLLIFSFDSKHKITLWSKR